MGCFLLVRLDETTPRLEYENVGGALFLLALAVLAVCGILAAQGAGK
jgi:hypothetical protein